LAVLDALLLHHSAAQLCEEVPDTLSCG
jgi:hypothetical protein